MGVGCTKTSEITSVGVAHPFIKQQNNQTILHQSIRSERIAALFFASTFQRATRDKIEGNSYKLKAHGLKQRRH